MKTYSVALSYFDGQRHVESAKSAGLAVMLQLAGLICQHATDKVSAVEVWEANGIGPLQVVFSWRHGSQIGQKHGYKPSVR